MRYAIIEPPSFWRPYHEMSRTELEAYQMWFHQVLPERIAELQAGSPVRAD